MQELTRIELIQGLSDLESYIHSSHILENKVLNRIFRVFNMRNGYYPHPSNIVRLRGTMNGNQFVENVEIQFYKVERLLSDTSLNSEIESMTQFWRTNFRGIGVSYIITNRIKLPQRDTGVELFHSACRVNSHQAAFLTWTNTYVPFDDLIEEIKSHLNG